MRFASISLLGAVLLSGCLRPQPDAASAGASAGQGGKKKASKIAGAQKLSSAAATRVSRITLVNEPRGDVASVHPTLGFVVIDFYLAPLPRISQRMAVYRQGMKVGEVKISGPEQNSNIVADVTSGNVSVGDEVRLE